MTDRVKDGIMMVGGRGNPGASGANLGQSGLFDANLVYLMKVCSMTNSIVLVDDDRNILTSVSMALEAEGFNVRTYGDGDEALRGLQDNMPDLVVLDIKMPRLDGMETLARLRQTSQVPVIFLTSKDDEVDELLGLRMGADDYIKKPFSQRLLIERIRSLLRRESARSHAGKSDENIMDRGDLILDMDRHFCTWQGKEVPLTVTEFLLIKTLAQRPGHVKTRNQLMDAAYGEHIYVDDRTIDSHVKRVRKKFKSVDDDFSGIETLYGVGYRYREHGDGLEDGKAADAPEPTDA